MMISKKPSPRRRQAGVQVFCKLLFKNNFNIVLPWSA